MRANNNYSAVKMATRVNINRSIIATRCLETRPTIALLFPERAAQAERNDSAAVSEGYHLRSPRGRDPGDPTS